VRRWAPVVAALVAAVLALPLAGVAPQGGDTAIVNVAQLRIGERATLTLTVHAATAAQVEVDPAADSWNGVEVLRIAKTATRDLGGGQSLFTLDVVIAPFVPGAGTFTPQVNVIESGVVTPRALPSVSWNVIAVLGPNDPLTLSPSPGPRAIEGAQSPLLLPAIIGGAIVAAAVLGLVVFLVGRWLLRPRPARVVAAPVEAAAPSLAAVEAIIDTDPVGAYRTLGGAVKAVLAKEYGFAAGALTTQELRQRMESFGVDRWQARLVGGLLEECDAVVYAGYRPAAERRRADLAMAQEIVSREAIEGAA
jgi:hypothetical protein